MNEMFSDGDEYVKHRHKKKSHSESKHLKKLKKQSKKAKRVVDDVQSDQDSNFGKKRSEDDTKYVCMPDTDLQIPEHIHSNLFNHQKVGISWLYNLYRENKGGVLGDDMGLGKTVQVAVYLRGLFEADLIKRVLIVVPATLKSYWETEL